jgi:hypothetical protein
VSVSGGLRSNRQARADEFIQKQFPAGGSSYASPAGTFLEEFWMAAAIEN